MSPAVLLRFASPVLVRLAWLAMAAVLLLVPIGREPLRVLDEQRVAGPRLPPSRHFLAWLAARKESADAGNPYPVFFIAAQGGGIRAAYWTSTLLAALEERYPGFNGICSVRRSAHCSSTTSHSAGGTGGAPPISSKVSSTHGTRLARPGHWSSRSRACGATAYTGFHP
jgi:hypothetical protein